MYVVRGLCRGTKSASGGLAVWAVARDSRSEAAVSRKMPSGEKSDHVLSVRSPDLDAKMFNAVVDFVPVNARAIHKEQQS